MFRENKWFIRFRRKYMDGEGNIHEHPGIVFRPEEDMQQAITGAIVEVLSDETIRNDGFVTIGVEVERVGTIQRNSSSEEKTWGFSYRGVV